MSAAVPDFANVAGWIGAGGMFLLLVLRQVLDFLRHRRAEVENSASGSRSTEFWQKEIRTIVRQELDEVLAPSLARQEQTLTDALEELRGIRKDFGEFIAVEKALRRGRAEQHSPFKDRR